LRVLALVQSPVAGDARVEREAAALASAGHQVTVVGRGVPAGYEPPDGVTTVDAGRPGGLAPGRAAAQGGVGGGRRMPSTVERAARWALLPEHRARVEAVWRRDAGRLVADLPVDVVHAHDLNTIELAGSVAAHRDVPMVYDAHELWSGRQLPGRPTPVGSRRQAALELRTARRAEVVLTVSEGIAERLRAGGLPDVRVVRNTFPVRGDEPSAASPPQGIVYAGRIGPGRDLETVLAASRRYLAGLRTVLVGPADHAYEQRLLGSGVDLLPALSVDGVDDIYRRLGIAAVTLTNSCDNHRLALPNKLFHAVRAGTPVVAADLPEIARVVRRHRLGVLYRPGDPASFADAVATVAANHAALVGDVVAARAELSWARDEAVLLEAYEGLRR
jgi:glycogen synthase